MAVGCYHAERVSGVFCIDSSPMDQRYHESFRELKDVVKTAKEINLENNRNEIEIFLKQKVPS